jgi:hypothetical protein
VLAYLENQIHSLQEMEFRPRLERLITDMCGLLGLGGGTITELLEWHKGSLSRPLLLFCLRERCTDRLEFSHPLLDDAEYILAGILFGVRDSWLQFPKEMRDVAVELASKCNWNDCFQTRITLAESPIDDELLRWAFSGSDKNGWFAMHSLNLPRHEYKRFGETDWLKESPFSQAINLMH